MYMIVLLFSIVTRLVSTDQSQQCISWSNIERELIHKAQQVNCTINSNCSGMSCSIHEYGYDISGGLSIDSCENPPSVLFSIDVPKLNINKWQKKFYHGDKFLMSETFGGSLEIEKKENNYILGLLLDIPSGIKPNSPLLHLIPSLASSSKHHIFQNISIYVPPCSFPHTESKPSVKPHILISKLSSSSSISSANVNSNCSIINSSCAVNEICRQIDKSSLDGICVCIPNYVRDNKGKCIYNPSAATTVSPNPSGSSSRGSNLSLLLTAILVPIAVIVLAVIIVYATIRFRILQHLRRRLRVQVYEHVLLGQEDDENDDEALNPVA